MAYWNSAELPEQDRYGYWQDVLCQNYVALDTVDVDRANFGGQVVAHPLSTINVTTISSVRQRIIRGSREIARMPSEVYFLNLQISGYCRMIQRGREAIVRPGEFALVDSTDPYEVDYRSAEWSQHSFRIPKSILDPLLRSPRSITAHSISGATGLGAVAVNLLSSIANNIGSISEHGSPLGGQMVDLIAMAIGATDQQTSSGRQGVRHAMIDSITKYIELNAADPNLSPAVVATHFRISLRYLHKLLEEGGNTFGKTLLASRLENCAVQLKNSPDRTISQIAMAWGFNDLSHFSRTFKARFGCSPSDYRSHPVRTEGVAFALPRLNCSTSRMVREMAAQPMA